MDLQAACLLGSEWAACEPAHDIMPKEAHDITRGDTGLRCRLGLISFPPKDYVYKEGSPASRMFDSLSALTAVAGRMRVPY